MTQNNQTGGQDGKRRNGEQRNVQQQDGGPGENIEPRPGEGMNNGEPGEDGRQDPEGEGMSQSTQEPAEGPRSEGDGRGQDR